MKQMDFELPGVKKDIRKHMIEAGRVLAKAQLNDVASGNVSVVLNPSGEDIDNLEMYITRSGSKLAHLDKPTAIVQVSLSGYDGNMVLASTETDIHAGIHRARYEEDADWKSSACAHAHAVHAAALSMIFEGTGKREIEIPKKYSSKRLGESVPVYISEFGSGAEDMTKNIPKLLAENPILILGGHGAFSVSGDLEKTLRYIMDLEFAAERMISDMTAPQKLRQMENRVPDDWSERYSISGVSETETYGGGDLSPKSLKELKDEAEDNEARRKYLNEIFEEFEETGQDLIDFSMDPFNRGCLSHRIGENVYITRLGVDFSNLEERDILMFRMDEGNEVKPGICEGWLHEAIYEDIATNYVAHLMPKHSTKYSIHCGDPSCNDAIIPIDVEGQYLIKKIPVARMESGVLSEENVGRLIEGLKSTEKVAYVEGLGGFALGFGEMYEPLHFLEIAENSTKMRNLAERIGVDVREREREFEAW